MFVMWMSNRLSFSFQSLQSYIQGLHEGLQNLSRVKGIVQWKSESTISLGDLDLINK